MAEQNRSSSRRVFRWKCTDAELIPVQIKNTEYADRLARIAEELYPLMNQLHESSYSLIHLGNNFEPKPVAPAAQHEGVCDGNKPIQEAA